MCLLKECYFCMFVNSLTGVILYTVTALLFMSPKFFLVAGSYCALVFIYVSNLLYVTVLQCKYLFPC